jgi:hypothetical protein
MREVHRPALALLLLGAALLACNAANLSASEPSPVLGPTDTAVPSATTVPPTVAVVTPEVTPTVPIVHTMLPGDPPVAARFVTDRSSAVLADEHRSIADDFNNGLFERPFTSQAMEYKAYLDLTRGEVAAGGLWLYVTLSLEGGPSALEPAYYGVEFDLDLDGRGDVLVAGAAPLDTNWTTDGVRVYQDTNDDVGGSVPVRADPPTGVGDGYDMLAFDQGNGPDPDAAWIRLSPSNPNQVQIALKQGLVNGDREMLWWGWTFAAPEPAWHDYQDHFTLEQAGSPLVENAQYPIKDLAEVDSTCRWAFDFNPVGSEPGVCPVPATPTPTRTPTRTPTPTLVPPS